MVAMLWFVLFVIALLVGAGLAGYAYAVGQKAGRLEAIDPERRYARLEFEKKAIAAGVAEYRFFNKQTGQVEFAFLTPKEVFERGS